MLDLPDIAPPDDSLRAALREKIDTRTKPPGSLGRLEELALEAGLIQGTLAPAVRDPQLVIFAADHGITAEGVSPYPKEVTPQMVLNFLGEGAAANALARSAAVGVTVVDAGVAFDFDAAKLPAGGPRFVRDPAGPGTGNFAREDAMTLEQLAHALALGRRLAREAVASGSNVLAAGDMGIGNTATAAMLHGLLTDTDPAQCAGRGTGLDDAGLAKKQAVLRHARERLPAAVDAQTALRVCGGFEIAAMAGFFLEGAAQKALLIIDGYIAGAALLAAVRLRPAVRSFAVFAHRSAEQGHSDLLKALDARPLLDLDLRLGEGTGAVLAVSLLRSACAFLNEMASFADAGVADRE